MVLALGTTQTLAWASTYYLPAILADPIARDLGISNNAVFAAFSVALLLTGLLPLTLLRRNGLRPAAKASFPTTPPAG